MFQVQTGKGKTPGSMESLHDKLHCYHRIEKNTIIVDKEHYGDNKCLLDLGTYAHNPLKVWLQDKRVKGNYPEFTVKSHSLLVDWGKAHEFNCKLDKDPNLHLEIQHQHSDLVMKSNVMSTKLDISNITKFDKTRDIDLRCLSWKVTVSLDMEMFEYEGNL